MIRVEQHNERTTELCVLRCPSSVANERTHERRFLPAERPLGGRKTMQLYLHSVIYIFSPITVTEIRIKPNTGTFVHFSYRTIPVLRDRT